MTNEKKVHPLTEFSLYVLPRSFSSFFISGLSAFAYYTLRKQTHNRFIKSLNIATNIGYLTIGYFGIQHIIYKKRKKYDIWNTTVAGFGSGFLYRAITGGGLRYSLVSGVIFGGFGAVFFKMYESYLVWKYKRLTQLESEEQVEQTQWEKLSQSINQKLPPWMRLGEIERLKRMHQSPEAIQKRKDTIQELTEEVYQLIEEYERKKKEKELKNS